MPLLLKNGRVLDPSQSLDDTLDLLINGTTISKLGQNLTDDSAQVIDASGLVIAPGFVDMHVHLREPGKEETETIESGTRAAAAGGFTAVACMPNTTPIHDRPEITRFILDRIQDGVDVLPIAAITIGEQGQELTNFAHLKAAGAVAFSDDGKPVVDSRLMRTALQHAKDLNLPVIDHCEDPYLFKGGAMQEGFWSQKLGILGIPSEAEEIMVARNILLAKSTGAHVHLAHLSTAGSMQIVRTAKQDRLPVTIEVTPHHFTLTDEAVSKYGTNAKMNPPLRTKQDVSAVLEAIADGTVDAIASDHAPHHADTKALNFDQAPFGIVGLETSVSLGLRLVHTGIINMNRFVELYSLNAARILGIKRTIQVGAEANLTVLNPDQEITVDASRFLSKSRNTPFDGWKLRGCAVMTIVRGQILFNHGDHREHGD